MCSNPQWGVNGFLNLPLSSSPDQLQFTSGQHQPCATVGCTRCGYTVIVNLITAGIVPRNG
jgi:hypothetical protein